MNPLEVITRRQDILLLIEPKTIKVYCNMDANTQDVTLIPSIELVQDMKIAEVLGKTLYDKLITEWITANGVPSALPDSLTSLDGIDYYELYQQIYKPLIWWSFVESVSAVAFKVSEQGVMVNKTDYSESLEVAAVNQVEYRARKNAEFYQEKLMCYIKEVFAEDASVQQESQEEGTFDCGIYFPITNRKCKNC